MKNSIKWLTSEVINDLRTTIHGYYYRLNTKETMTNLIEECLYILLKAYNINCKEEAEVLFKIYKSHKKVNEILRTKYQDFRYSVKLTLDKNDLSLQLKIIPEQSKTEQMFILFQ